MKKVIFVLILYLTFINSVIAIEVKSNNVIMYNLNDNSIIYEKNSSEKVSIASLTKILTAITVIENKNSLEEYVAINSNMLLGLDGYAKIGLQVGDRVKIIDLLYALMLPSAADAAQALSISTSGSVYEFSKLMNEEAKKIGVENSCFDNPVGMDSKDNYSTVQDVAKILIYSLNNKIFKEIFESNTYYISSIDKTVEKTIVKTSDNYNIDISLIKGAKTGYTQDAGLCLASTSSINGVNYLIVTINSPISYPYNLTDSINLYNYFSNNYSYRTVIKKDQILERLKIKNGYDKYYNIVSEGDITLYLPNDAEIEYSYDGIDVIDSSIKLGDKIGSINISSNHNSVYDFDVYLEQKLKYHNYTLYIFIVLLVLISIIMIAIFKRNKK